AVPPCGGGGRGRGVEVCREDPASFDGLPPPAPPRKGEGSGEPCAKSRVDFLAVCAAEKSARRSLELLGGGCKPVLDPSPAVPAAMPGLSSFSRCGAIGASGSPPPPGPAGGGGGRGFFFSGGGGSGGHVGPP